MTVSVVVPVSPIPSHPDVHVLTETVESVRHHLPDAELFLCFDGVRPEQESRREAYEEHIRRVLWLARGWGAVVPWIFDEHRHQVGMLRAVISEVRTPLMLFAEQDTPLVCDEPIDWNACTDLVLSGEADIVRFHHEAAVPEAHSHMVIGEVENGFLRTCQYSARPHLASTDYYRRVLTDHFSPNANCFLEDLLHGVCHEAYKLHGMDGWSEHRIWIFHPNGNIKRSAHSDGRAGEEKYDDRQVF